MAAFLKTEYMMMSYFECTCLKTWYHTAALLPQAGLLRGEAVVKESRSLHDYKIKKEMNTTSKTFSPFIRRDKLFSSSFPRRLTYSSNGFIPPAFFCIKNVL